MGIKKIWESSKKSWKKSGKKSGKVSNARLSTDVSLPDYFQTFARQNVFHGNYKLVYYKNS